MTQHSPSDTCRMRLLHRALLCLVIISCLAVFGTPALATRDVRIGLTELKPSLYSDDQGKPAGFFVDIIQDMAAREGWNVIWVSGTLAESWSRLNTSQIDLMPGVAETPERKAFFDFNHEPALSVWSQVYARPGSDIQTILDLDGKRVATVKGAQSGIAFGDYARRFGINVTLIDRDTPAEVFAATAKGETDALIVYNTAGQEDARTYGLTNTPVMFNPTPLVFAVQKGKNPDLLAAIDREMAEGKRNPSSTYNQAMQKWYGIGSNPVIPPWIFWGLGMVLSIAILFVIMSFLLRREVLKKTNELSRQNRELQAEVASRKRAEEELLRKNEELNAAYEEMTATEESLRENYQELRKSEQALMQARKKLNFLNTLAIQDIQTRIFSLAGFFEIARDAGCSDKAKGALARGDEILRALTRSMNFAKKYQDLGIYPPRWQNANIVLLNALSHVDYSRITRTGTFGNLEIYADPLLEEVFLVVMDQILLPEGGATEVRIGSREENGSIMLILEDNGKGIPVTEKERIFERDYPAPGRANLFLAREILSITNSTIRETGTEGHGTRFEIVVPSGEYRFAVT